MSGGIVARRTVLAAWALAAGLPVFAADGLVSLGIAGQAPEAPWRFTGVPNQKFPRTAFSLVKMDGAPVALRVASEGSYGNLLHPLPHGKAATLSWRWRLDQPNAAADLRNRAGDDMALKVCALFDLPLAAVPFVDRQLLRVAQMAAAEPLPAATICYVWDSRLAAGTVLDNAYTRRLRIMVLRGPDDPLQAWQAERRDLSLDFRALFGDESREVPPLIGILIGGDADNTQGRSLGFVAEPSLK